MKIVRLEQDRIKVTLSDDELLEMNIDFTNLTPNSPQLSIFLCEVMDAVKAETGFTIDSGQVVVEAAPCEDGIVLMLSRTGKSADKSRLHPIRAKNRSIIFEFLSFEDLSGMLLNTDSKKLIYMKLYTYSGKFYLAVPRQHIPVIIYEYSLKNRKASIAESALREYGKMIAAGYNLVNMALDLKKMN